MFLLLDKSKGISSFKYIRDYARENNIKKIGHTGTLDPLATGLLLIATDDDTKLIDFIDKGEKTYVAEMEMGFTSDTYDIEGEVKETGVEIPSEKEIIKALMSFEGEQEQMPPAFSAKKINGQTAYKLAREGKEVKLKPSLVSINKIKFINRIDNKITFEVNVSRGTYIRSIIHDLGAKLKCGAIMTELRRTTIGPLTEENIGIDINIEKLLTLPVINIDKEELEKLKHGISISNKTNKKGQFIIKVNNVICGIVTLTDVIKSNKLFGNKIDTI